MVKRRFDAPLRKRLESRKGLRLGHDVGRREYREILAVVVPD